MGTRAEDRPSAQRHQRRQRGRARGVAGSRCGARSRNLATASACAARASTLSAFGSSRRSGDARPTRRSVDNRHLLPVLRNLEEPVVHPLVSCRLPSERHDRMLTCHWRRSDAQQSCFRFFDHLPTSLNGFRPERPFHCSSGPSCCPPLFRTCVSRRRPSSPFAPANSFNLATPIDISHRQHTILPRLCATSCTYFPSRLHTHQR